MDPDPDKSTSFRGGITDAVRLCGGQVFRRLGRAFLRQQDRRCGRDPAFLVSAAPEDLEKP